MFQLELSNHGQTRISQRAIDQQSIDTVLEYGQIFMKQGLTFYAVKDALFPDDFDHQLKEKADNLVVVMNGNETEVITCYKAKNAIKHLKRKSKVLL